MMGWQPRPTIAAMGIVLALAVPARAADPGGDALKAEIEGFLAQLSTSTKGVVTWDGADPYEFRQDGDASVAVITHARLSIHGPEVAQLGFDRIEIARTVEKDSDGKLVDFAWVLPKEATLTEADGTQTKLTLKEATAKAVMEAQSGMTRESEFAIAGARLEHAKTGSWINFGPLKGSAKIVPDANGGWTAPSSAEMSKIEFFFPQGPFGGAIDRIASDGKAAGPSLKDYRAARDAITAVSKDDKLPPEARLAALMDLLPGMPVLFSVIQGQFAVEGLTVRVATGAPLIALAKASFGTELTGLDGDNASWRITLRQDGLDLAPSLLDAAKVPHRVVVDLGLEQVSTAALKTVITAASKMTGGASDEEKKAATQQMLGAAATLDPVFRIYDASVDTEDVGVAATAETTGSPLSPKGYTAQGDVLVRGFDAIPALAAGVPLIEYLPVLKEMATAATGPDGSPRLKFHLASAPPKWITVNDNDVSAWLMDGSQPGQPRVLKPAEPPMQGSDVASVQRALAAAKIPVDQDGVYGPPTAIAVARFQHQAGINVNGVVDAPTRQKLGVKAETPHQPGGGGGLKRN